MVIYKTAVFPDFIDILQRKYLNKWYIVDLEVNTFTMVPNMTCFEITEVSGHTATGRCIYLHLLNFPHSKHMFPFMLDISELLFIT